MQGSFKYIFFPEGAAGEKYQEFHLRPINFEMPIEQPSGDVK